MACNNATMSGVVINRGRINLEDSQSEGTVRFRISSDTSVAYMTSEATFYGSNGDCSVGRYGTGGGYLTCKMPGNQHMYTSVNYSGIKTPKLEQTSLQSIKKNISLFNKNVLETILNSDIYSYNLKSEKDTDNKHIGFVIGDKYRTPKEVINKEGNAIELYSAIGILWKGMQEQQKKIEELENKIKEK